MNTSAVLVVSFCIALVTLARSAQGLFFSDQPESRNFAQANPVDVFFEYSPYEPGNTGIFPSGKVLDVAKGLWDRAEEARHRVVCKSNTYRLIANLEQPGIDELVIDGSNLLDATGIGIEVEDSNGTIYRSQRSAEKARCNTWRAGFWYYDTHLLDFKLLSEDGAVLPADGELVIHAFPDKVHVEARLKLTKEVSLRRVELAGRFAQSLQNVPGGNLIQDQSGTPRLAVFGGMADGRVLTTRLSRDPSDPDVLSGYFAFFPGTDKPQLEQRLLQEAQPLGASAFQIEDGIFLGYDAAKGVYGIKSISGLNVDHFESFYLNPNLYLAAGIELSNDALDRRIYIRHASDPRSLETALLTDPAGCPLPVAVQSSKNFKSEKEEPDDTAFNESYFPLELRPNEHRSFRSLHLHQNWGNHPLRQVSSVRFFQIYYHLSHGVTETTCFSLPTKFGNTPANEPRAYVLADYRPLSGTLWIGQPQHHHVSLEGWLQYLDAAGNWRYPVYTGSEIYSAGPNLAWFTLNYVSSDGKVDEHLEIFEMPQSDESRTRVKIRYTFLEDVVVSGDPRQTLRLLNKGSYILKKTWPNLAWTAADGSIKKSTLNPDGKWAALGEALRPWNAFFCAYPHPQGNPGLVLRKASGTLNGKPFTQVGFSAIAQEDGKTELMLVPLLEGNTIRKGSCLELDCILIPYGDGTSGLDVPLEESNRFGLNRAEFAQWQKESGDTSVPANLFGPELEVLRGTKVLDDPPFVKTEGDVATVKYRGGHDRVSLIVSGYSGSGYPMLWNDLAFVDFQALGNDGVQRFQNRDGTYGCIFTPTARTEPAGKGWGSKAQLYHATQAISEPGIESVDVLNGRVRIRQAQPGNIELVSPRLWVPAEHTWKSDDLNTLTSQAQCIRTVPITLVGANRPDRLYIEEFSPERIVLNLSATAPCTLAIGGLYPDSDYSIHENSGEPRIVRSNRSGDLILHADQDASITLTRTDAISP